VNSKRSPNIAQRLECTTADCSRPATRHAKWTRPFPGEGDYCEDCAERLWRAGDDVQPPMHVATVTPIR